MARPRKFAKRFTATTLLIGMVMVAGVAFAAWTATGSGSGSAKAGTATALSAVGVTPGGGNNLLYPGTNGDVKLTVTNPNPYDVQVNTVSGSGPITSDKGAACDASTGVSFSNQSGLTTTVPKNGGTATITLTNAASMSNSSDNTCQGAVFTIPVTLGGVSV